MTINVYERYYAAEAEFNGVPTLWLNLTSRNNYQ